MMPLDFNSQGKKCLTDLPMIIFIGGTGVGKTTTINLLKHRNPEIMEIPGRRYLTDHFIIRPMQRQEGKPEKTLRRTDRYPYLERYRRVYPAGMAHVLSRLYIEESTGTILFDGLRGIEEVVFALKEFPKAKLILVHASLESRLFRLLKRQDPHDSHQPNNQIPMDELEEILGVLVDKNIRQKLIRGVLEGVYSTNEIFQKATILLTEEAEYKPQQVLAYLKQATFPCCILETDHLEPHQAADAVSQFLKDSFSNRASGRPNYSNQISHVK